MGCRNLLILFFVCAVAHGEQAVVHSMCRKVLNLAAEGLQSGLPRGGEISLANAAEFPDGLTVVDPTQGIRVLTRIAPEHDGTVSLYLKYPTDAKNRPPQKLTVNNPRHYQLAALGSDAGRKIMQQRTENFLRKSMVGEPDIARVPDQIALTYLATRFFGGSDNEVRRAHQQHYLSLWSEFTAERPELKNLEFTSQLKDWFEQSHFLYGEKPLHWTTQGGGDPKRLKDFINFVHARTGENLIESGALLFADFTPHINTGLELPVELHSIDEFQPEQPNRIPHDVLVNLINYSWRHAGEAVKDNPPAEFGLGSYLPAQRGVPGTFTQRVNQFKDTNDLTPVKSELDRQREKIKGFIESHLRTGDQAVVVPVPSSSTGRASAGLTLLAQNVAGIVSAPTAELTNDGAKYSQKNQKFLWERVQNAMAAFFPSQIAPEAVAGKVVVLVDDVQTTGSTVAAARVRLNAFGAKKVIVVSLAKSGAGHESVVLPSNGDSGSAAVTPAKPATTKASTPFSDKRPDDLAAFMNQEAQVRKADPLFASAIKTAVTLAASERDKPVFDFLRLLKREKDVLKLLVEAKRLNPDRPELAKRYDVNFLVTQFNLFEARRKVEVIVALVEPTPYEKFLIDTMIFFRGRGESLGAYPNALTPGAKSLLEALARGDHKAPPN